MKTRLALSTTALFAALVQPVIAAELSLDSAPPVVVRTVPTAGALDVDPALSEIRVTYSKPMQDGSGAWSRWQAANFPETITNKPPYLTDGRTCVLPVRLQPGKSYALWLHGEQAKGFKDTNGQAAVPYLLTFTTASSTAAPALTPLPKAEDLPGQLTFQGRYRHRSRGSDINTPSELWVKESPDGSLNVLAQLPFSESAELASGNRKNALTGYRIGRNPSGERPGYGIDLELADGMARLNRRGVQQDVDGKTLKVPAGAWFDPNTRPDSYCAANILLRAFALAEGETKDFRVYDWDNSGEALVGYTIRVRHAGKERVEVPAGIFEANHLVLTQITTADTWYKKRAGHVTDFWVLDNHVIVRVLRHREPYEMLLLDCTTPAKLETSPLAQAAVAPAKTEVAAQRKFVRAVLDEKRMTFEGEPASWESLERLLAAIPDRDRTVLEWAVASTQITIQQQSEWSTRFAELARKHGFEYSSYVGVHPLGSKGGMPPAGQAATDSPVADAELPLLLNDDQKAVVAWTDRQFRSFFDARTFDGWPAEERANLERRSIDALNGPRSTEYYQAINTLAALRSTNALPRLREIAFERVDRNNRDRWMCIRALGIIGDKSAVPELIHLVYHGNQNTHWWAQISLVRLTGKNAGKDWHAWGQWWNESGGQPPFNPEIVRWWDGQPEPDKLAESLAESDRKFLADVRGEPANVPAPIFSSEVAARLRTAAPLMDGIRRSWAAAVEAIQRDDATNALAALRTLAPRIQEFREMMKGTSLEAGTADALEKVKVMTSALEKGDMGATQPAMEAMLLLGQSMEAQVKAINDTSRTPAPEPAPTPVPPRRQ